MPSTYEPIATTALGSAAATVTFSSIPSTYTDLVLVCNVKATTTSNAYLRVRYNTDTSNNYSITVLSGNGSAASSARGSNTSVAYLNYNYAMPTTMETAIISNIQNYSNTTTYKTAITRSNAASQGVEAMVTLWRSTAAINNIVISTDNGGAILDTGSTFTLYGIKAA
jgi:hypothetical protein